jgi:hypothetical protein
MSRLSVILLLVVIPMVAQAGPGERNDTLFMQTRANVVAKLMVTESGPDFRLCWAPIQASGAPSVYLIFLRPKGEPSWLYFDYSDDTCFVHYGASLFYPEMSYEVHAYFGSLRKLPGYPRNPQDPRLPGDAIRSFWEPSDFFHEQRD